MIAWARIREVPYDTIVALSHAAYEAIANAVEHAYAGSTGTVPVTARLSPDGTLTAVVADTGRWRPPPSNPRHRGHGLTLIQRLADHAEIRQTDSGTAVEMRWHLR